MRIAIVSDTHLPRFGRALLEVDGGAVTGADLVRFGR